jgi:diguanylate cyclase (GGDEF)-like protein
MTISSKFRAGTLRLRASPATVQPVAVRSADPGIQVRASGVDNSEKSDSTAPAIRPILEGTAVRRETTVRPPRAGTTRRTTFLAALAILSGLVVLITLLLSVRGTESRARVQARRALPAEAALHATWSASTSGQAHFLTAIQATDPLTRGAALREADLSGQRQHASWKVYLEHALDRPGEHTLQQSYESSAARAVDLAANLLGASPEDPEFATQLAAERSEHEAAVAALQSLESKIYEPAILQGADDVVSGLDTTRTAVVLSYSALALVVGAISAALIRGSLRDDRRRAADAAATRTEAEYAKLETSLQRALEMEGAEEATYGVIAQALSIVAPDVPTEMLLADSSQAHFRQVLTVAPEGDSACRVGSPEDCPAATSGQTQVFANSTDLDTCPLLRDRSEAVWATCVPVSIAGRSTAVIHAQRSLDRPSGDTRRGWELVARKAGDRIGMLRAFARSETQAHTDPLTGLLNRRSLDTRTRDLTDQGLPFVVAYGDLDHFKLLNDVHGHDAGDRALRLFARVLRDSVRPNDIPARYGGEEFVAVLPDCSIENAVAIVERVRTSLQHALTGGTVPLFTVSFGLAASEPGLSFGETVDAADQALLRAKREGRDRIVVSDADAAAAAAAVTTSGQPPPDHLPSHPADQPTPPARESRAPGIA